MRKAQKERRFRPQAAAGGELRVELEELEAAELQRGTAEVAAPLSQQPLDGQPQAAAAFVVATGLLLSFVAGYGLVAKWRRQRQQHSAQGDGSSSSLQHEHTPLATREQCASSDDRASPEDESEQDQSTSAASVGGGGGGGGGSLGRGAPAPALSGCV